MMNALEAGESVVITAFYSNRLLLFNELKIYLKRRMPSKSFKEQHEYRAKYHALSSLILIEIVDHKCDKNTSNTKRTC
jgi:hypothetical protein